MKWQCSTSIIINVKLAPDTHTEYELNKDIMSYNKHKKICWVFVTGEGLAFRRLLGFYLCVRVRNLYNPKTKSYVSAVGW